MKISERVFYRPELYSLHRNRLNHIGDTLTKETKNQGTETKIGVAVELCFQSAIFGINNFFTRLLKMALIFMIHKATLDTILVIGIAHLSYSDASIDALAEKIHRHLELA